MQTPTHASIPLVDSRIGIRSHYHSIRARVTDMDTEAVHLGMMVQAVGAVALRSETQQ